MKAVIIFQICHSKSQIQNWIYTKLFTEILIVIFIKNNLQQS